MVFSYAYVRNLTHLPCLATQAGIGTIFADQISLASFNAARFLLENRASFSAVSRKPSIRRVNRMDYDAFYSELFAPLEEAIGPVDAETIVAIIGFDAGGPLNFSTIGYAGETELGTFVSCELAVREEQIPASFGRYELLTTCDNEEWVRSTLTALGHATMEFKFGHRHTLDIGVWVDDDAAFQGLLLERESTAKIGGKKYGVMRVIGLTRPELDFAIKKNVPQLVTKLKKAGFYPNTLMERESVV